MEEIPWGRPSVAKRLLSRIFLVYCSHFKTRKHNCRVEICHVFQFSRRRNWVVFFISLAFFFFFSGSCLSTTMVSILIRCFSELQCWLEHSSLASGQATAYYDLYLFDSESEIERHSKLIDVVNCFAFKFSVEQYVTSNKEQTHASISSVMSQNDS